MLTAVTCPKCEERFEAPNDAVDQPIRCPRCAYGIQAMVAATPLKQREGEPEVALPRRRPMPRAAFPLTSLLIVALGLLFFLFAVSVGFNVWILANQNHRFHFEEEAMHQAQLEAMEMRMQAEKEAERARLQNQGGIGPEIELRRQLAELQRELDQARDQLEDARRRAEKVPRDR